MRNFVSESILWCALTLVVIQFCMARFALCGIQTAVVILAGLSCMKEVAYSIGNQGTVSLAVSKYENCVIPRKIFKLII